MKKIILPFLLLVAFVSLPQAKAAGDLPRVTRPSMIEVENASDTTVSLSRTENPFLLSGLTRGVYLDGYGAVFTVEVNLVAINTAQMMFRPVMGKPEIAQHRQKKLARLPELKKAMQTAMADAAVSLKNLPDDERIVFVALIAKYPWEDLNGVPLQVMMQSTRKQLAAARGNAAALDAAIRVTEN